MKTIVLQVKTEDGAVVATVTRRIDEPLLKVGDIVEGDFDAGNFEVTGLFTEQDPENPRGVRPFALAVPV